MIYNNEARIINQKHITQEAIESSRLDNQGYCTVICYKDIWYDLVNVQAFRLFFLKLI